MHPAPSVIVFTVLSGLGFGMLAFLGLNMPDVTGFNTIFFYGIGMTLAVVGLLASVFHLKNKKNAYKAFSQLRSSWLSREGFFAVAALMSCALVAAFKLFLGFHPTVFGIISSVLCLITVFTTAMIYTQLKTVPRWNMWLTPVLFMLSSLAGGAVLAAQIVYGFPLFVLLMLVQIAYWYWGDGAFARSGHTIETATGLGFLGKARQFEPPHTGQNYLLNEMVYVIGRKHAMKLRVIGIIMLSVLPLAALWFLPISHVQVAIVLLIHLLGLIICRWLFFAEAEHVVGLYYDKR